MASDTALVVRSRGQLRTAGLLAALALLAAVSAASVAVGSVHIPLGDVVGALVDPEGTDEHVIVRDVRVPRTLVGIAVGGALGIAGALLQGLTRNPLADPGILGFEAGAALAVVAAIFLLGVSSIAGYVWFALAGAAVAGGVVYALGASGGSRAAPVTLALAGAAVTALLTAFTSAILILDIQTLNEFRFWVAGSLAGRDLAVLAGAVPFIGCPLVTDAERARRVAAEGSNG